MKEEKEEPEDDTPIEEGTKALSGYAKYTGVAFQMMAIIGICALIGYKLDEYYKNDPQWITALSSVIGVVASIYQVIRQLKS
ncbi:MAG: AtpZ/AtpI family protein [Sphingobacteriaceae bacterium]|nr:AtpZ/AtpI family protein [Sphingobacteriaceae bacterium]